MFEYLEITYVQCYFIGAWSCGAAVFKTTSSEGTVLFTQDLCR